MNMQAENGRSLPPQRAFVVQFSTGANLARERCQGRVEHIVSGQVHHFESLGELLAFVDCLLAETSPDAGTRGD